MRHRHPDCERAIEDALARGLDGYAEYLATRCDLWHDTDTHTVTTPVTPVTAPPDTTSDNPDDTPNTPPAAQNQAQDDRTPPDRGDVPLDF